MSKYSCGNCGLIFEGENDFNTKYKRDGHEKYCKLPTIHKVLGVLAFPLAFITIGVVIPGMILYFVFAPIAYPFLYATNMMFDSEPLSWAKFRKMVYGDDGVHSYKTRAKGEG